MVACEYSIPELGTDDIEYEMSPATMAITGRY